MSENATTTLPLTADYGDLIAYQGLDVLGSAAFGDYQGDYLYAVRDPEKKAYGVIIVGFGSCSGCDVLMAMTAGSYEWGEKWPAERLAEVLQYAKQLVEGTHWGTRESLTQLLLGRDSLLEWYRHEDGYESAIRDVLAQIPEDA